MNEGLARNAEIASYAAAVAAAKGERTQAGLWKNPEFTGDYGGRRVADGAGAVAKGTTRSASLRQTFEFPGKGTLRKAVADRDVELAELGLAQFRASLEGRIRKLAFRHAAAASGAEAAERIGQRASELVRLLRERPLAGPQQTVELALIEGSLVEIHVGAGDLVRSRDEARLELNALLGRPARLPLAVRGVPDLPAPELAEDRLVLAGLDRNPLLKTRQAEIARAAKQLSATRLDAVPDFSVGPFFSQDRAGEKEENFGGSLTVTLPLWDWNQGRIAVAGAREAQAEALLADARYKVEAEIVRRIRAYRLAKAQLDRTPPELLARSREASDLADREYRAGGLGVQLYLESQRSLLALQRSRNEALLAAWDSLLDLRLLVDGDPFAPSAAAPAIGR